MVQSTVPAAFKRRRLTRHEKKSAFIAYTFLAPNFLGFLVFTLVPVLSSILLSLLNWGGGDISKITWAGLNNYAIIFKNFSFTKSSLGIALANTVIFTAITVPLTIACSLGLALVLNRAARVAKLLRVIFFYPYVSSLVAVCICWSLLLYKFGPINQALSLIGVNIGKSWTSSKDHAMLAIIIVSVWRSAGYYMVMYLAGLQGVPRELYEAATVDGATAWQKFRFVTFPMLTPTTFFVSIMMVISCFKIYDIVEIMTQGGPGRSTLMLVSHIYTLSFTEFKYGVASAVAMVLFAVVLTVTIIQFKAEKKWVNYM